MPSRNFILPSQKKFSPSRITESFFKFFQRFFNFSKKLKKRSAFKLFAQKTFARYLEWHECKEGATIPATL